MKIWSCLIALLLVLPAYGQTPVQSCKHGPVTKVFGAVPWLVYSCDDAKSVVIVSAPGSPAAPFYVVQLRPKGSAYSDAERDAIEAAFFRLDDTYGANEVITVMVAVIVDALKAARDTGTPGNVLWAADLKARLKRAPKKTL